MEPGMDLIQSASQGDVENVQRLIDGGADVNFEDADGDTALHWASRNRHEAVVKELVKLESLDISKENKNNETALDVAEDENAQDCWRTIGECIETKAKRICEESEPANCAAATVPQNTLKTFVQATLEGDMAFPLSNEDSASILQFLVPKWQCEEPTNPNIVLQIEFEFENKANLILRLILKEKEKPWSKLFSINDQMERLQTDISERVDMKHSDHDISVIIYVYKLQIMCEEWSSILKKPEAKGSGKNKAEENLSSTPKKSKQLTITDSAKDLLKNLRDNIQTLHKFGRKTCANILQEIEKANQKRAIVLSSLKEILAKSSVDFSPRECIVVFQFLETFALQDTDLVAETNEEALADLKYLKKEWYLSHFPSPSGKCMGHIKNFRSYLHHKDSSNRKIIDPPDFNAMIVCSGKPEVFLQCLLDFATLVDEKMRSVSSKSDESVGSRLLQHISKFEKEKTTINFVTKPELNFDEVLRRFSKNVGSLLAEKHLESMDSILFDFFFNITPKLENRSLESKRLFNLRKLTAHEFNRATPEEIQEELSFAVPELYRQQLSEEIYKTMCNLDVDAEEKGMKEDFLKTLQSMTGKFQNYKLWLPQLTGGEYLASTLQANSEGESQRWPGEEMLQLYLKYMAPLFDSNECNAIEDHDTGISRNYIRSLDDVDRLKIFEEFIKLDEASDGSKETKKQELTIYLHNKVPLDIKDKKFIIDAVINDTVEITDQLIAKMEDTMKSLKKLFQTRLLTGHKIADQYVIAVVQAYSKNKEQFSLDNYGYVFKEWEEAEKDSVLETLQHLESENGLGEASIGKRKVQISVSSAVVNLLKLTVQKYKLYQVEFQTVEEAFADETFLSFLVNHDIASTSGAPELRDFNQAYKNIQLIRKLTFSAPYIVSLLTRVMAVTVIRKDDLLGLFKSLTMDNSYRPYLVSILRMNTPKITWATPLALLQNDIGHDTLCAIIQTLAESGSLDDCFCEVTKCSSLPAPTLRTNRLLSSSNDVAYEYVCKNQFNLAVRVLEVAEKCETNLGENGAVRDAKIVAARKRIEAEALRTSAYYRYKTSKASFPNMPEEARAEASAEVLKEYEKALQVLDSTPDRSSIDDSLYMLILSLKSLLSGFVFVFDNSRMEHAEKSLTSRRELWNVLWQHISGENGDPPEFLKVYERAQTSQSYFDLLALGPEYKYLDVCREKSSLLKCECMKIKSDITFDKKKIARKIDCLKPLLTEWNTIRHVLNTEARVTKDEFKTYRSLIVLIEKAKVHNEIAGLFLKLENRDSARFHQYKMIELNMMTYKGRVSLRGRADAHSRESLEALNKSLSQLNKTNIPGAAPASGGRGRGRGAGRGRGRGAGRGRGRGAGSQV